MRRFDWHERSAQDTCAGLVWRSAASRLVPVGGVALAAWLVAAAGASVALPADQLSDRDRADIARIEIHLNTVKTMTGRFLQVAADGTISEGRFYLRRPRRFRFEYDPPSPILLVGDGLWLVFHDRELGQVSRVPIGSSPIALLVDREIALSGRTGVKALQRQRGLIRLTLYDRDKPDLGEIALILSDPPLALRQWAVTDAQGLVTKVSLFDTEINVPLKAELFVFTEPPEAPDQP